MRLRLIPILFLFFSLNLWANGDAKEEAKVLSYVPRVYEPPASEKALNFGIAYTAQWADYIVSQKKVIKEGGSYKNWHHNILSPHFDNDSFDYNIFKHGITGNYYFLFYRSRGYDRVEAFFWAFLSSAAFEFTIESFTERPSYQDLYQTPVYGTILGIGVEKLSIYFHRQDSWWGHTLGYMLNPFTLIPEWKHETKVSFTPYFDSKKVGGLVTYDF
jgi:hypothetical protein